MISRSKYKALESAGYRYDFDRGLYFNDTSQTAVVEEAVELMSLRSLRSLLASQWNNQIIITGLGHIIDPPLKELIFKERGWVISGKNKAKPDVTKTDNSKQ